MSKDNLIDHYNNKWISAGFASKKEEMIYKKRGEKELTEYYKKNKSFIKPPLYIEKKFTIDLAGRPFKGFIDRIDELDENYVEIIDYKTSKSEKESPMQLDIYAIAAVEKLGLNVEKVSYYYISTNKKRTFKRTDEDIENTKAIAEKTIKCIESGNFDPTTSFNCNHCDFQILCPAYPG